jgi:hypothetical protein
MEYPLPNFFVVGAVKAGTTALHLFLDQHPEIFMSPVKETNFFSQPDMHAEHFNRDYRHDVNVNLERFLEGSMSRKIHIANVDRWEDYQRLFRDAKGFKAIGEASNSYLLCPSAAAAMAERCPDARVLMMLRNPVERVWSQYLMNLRLGKTLSEDLIAEFEADSTKEHQGWGVSHNYRELGMYAGQLQRFYDHFPRQHVKVLLYDDYRLNPEATIRDIFRFLGVNPDVVIDLDQRPNEAAVPRFKQLNYLLFQSGLVNKVKQIVPESWKGAAKQAMFSNKDMPAMAEHERIYMRELYRKDVLQLGQMLNRDLSHWLA